MARHEIAFHSDMHSAHTTWAEYLDTTDWDGGVARVMREESRGIAAARELFGQQPSAWCKPGASWGPQVAHAMALMDVPVFCDAPFEAAPGQPLWYDNNLFLNYHTSFDRYFGVPPGYPRQVGERLERMKADFLALCEAHDGGYLVMYTHPCRLFTAQFTDTFRHGRNPPREQWQPAPQRPAAEIAALQEDFDAFLGWVVRQPNVELTTYRALFESLKQPAAPWLPADPMLSLCDAGSGLDYRWLEGICLSPAEQFGVVARAAAVWGAEGRLPEAVAVRRLLGPTETPPSPAPEARMPWTEFAAAARRADQSCTETGAVPARIPLGGGAVGPNAFLQAAARALADWGRTGQAPESVEIRPVGEDPAIVARDDFARQRFTDIWSIFPPDFAGRNVLQMIRLQAWTAKPAVR